MEKKVRGTNIKERKIILRDYDWFQNWWDDLASIHINVYTLFFI